MDPVLLARIQFAFTVGFHYIFPPLTLGLTLLIVVFLALNLKTKEEVYDRAAGFLIGILAIVFSVGVASGIVMEFQFGTNWERYSRFVGDIFGAPLAAEGIFAFFLESTFLGILLFGKKRVSKKMYFFAALMVMIGSMLSGLWIIIANSWQQTPAGYHIVNGRAELTNFWEAALNHSTLHRYVHVILGGWIAGSFFVSGVAAWFMLKKKHINFAKKLMLVSLSAVLISAGLQVMSGHGHAVQVTHTQPEKMATFESIFETQTNAPMVIFGIPNQEKKTIDYEISIPGLLSYMIAFDADYEFKGLNDFKQDELPPLLVPFFSYRVMVGLGFYFVFMGLLGVLLIWRDKITQSALYLKLLLFGIPLPIIANEAGWFSAEVGRQPWIVYRLLKTADGVSSVVSAAEILFSLILFGLLYSAMFVMFIFLIKRKVLKGPESAGQAY